MMRMSKGLAICALAFAAGWASLVEAASKYWVAPAAGNWNSNANWSTTSGGTGGAAVPGAGDLAVFDGGGLGDCAINAAVNVAGLALNSGYAGTLTQGAAFTITVGTSGWSQAEGGFTGGTNTIILNGSWNLSGGTFNAGNQTIKLVGDATVARGWTCSGGTFAPGGSTVWFYPDTAGLTISNSTSFSNLTLNGVYQTHYGNLTIPTGTTLTVSGTLRLYDGDAQNNGVNFLGTGTIAAQGDISASHMNPNSYGDAYAGTVRLLINGTGDQTFTNAGARLSRVEIDKPSGTLSLAGTFVVGGESANPGYWTYNAGALDAGTSTVNFLGDNGGLTISGSHTLSNVRFDSIYFSHGNTIALATGTTLTTTGVLTFGNTNVPTSTSQPTLNTGAINAAGDVGFVLNNNCGGTAVLNFTGSSTQQVSYSGDTATRFRLTRVTVNKTGGAVKLATDLSLGTAGQQLVWTNGALNLSSNTLTVASTTTIYAAATTLGVTVADAAKAGRLVCNSAVIGLTNVGLAVSVAAAAEVVAGQTYTILTNSAVLTPPFKSVTWLGPWKGDVAYTANGGRNVTLSNILRNDNGTVMVIW